MAKEVSRCRSAAVKAYILYLLFITYKSVKGQGSSRVAGGCPAVCPSCDNCPLDPNLIGVSLPPFARSTEDCIQRDSSGTITGLNQESIDKFPFLVSLQLENSEYYTHQCGGTMIGSRMVLTAAHCIYDIQQYIDYREMSQNEGEIQVTMWAAFSPMCRHQGRQRCKVERYYLHPEFQGIASLGFDIAVLLLEPCSYSGPFVSYDEYIDLRSASPFLLLGWGSTTYAEDAFKNHDVYVENVKPLQQVLLQYSGITWAQCQYNLRDDQFCTTYITANATGQFGDSCTGDSGGPLLLTSSGFSFEPRQVGIVSWGPVVGCSGQQDSPGVFTITFKRLAWLQSTVGKIEALLQSGSSEVLYPVAPGPFSYVAEECLNLEGKIVQTSGDIPYLVSLQKEHNKDQNYFQQYCQGVLIAPKTVLTAANCIYDVQSMHQYQDFRQYYSNEGNLNGKLWVAINPLCRHQANARRYKAEYFFYPEEYDVYQKQGDYHNIAIILLEDSSGEYTGPFPKLQQGNITVVEKLTSQVPGWYARGEYDDKLSVFVQMKFKKNQLFCNSSDEYCLIDYVDKGAALFSEDMQYVNGIVKIWWYKSNNPSIAYVSDNITWIQSILDLTSS
eukprot:TRINITY_DN2582_c0_g1_i9.p1 TRINITY_DN2582_c0_g1~~TRINITY_DN2582_c0_g1_i9.p1  ORF type:complete len:613 (-),score=17.08 TRINITY_DN2582_c0_g1_i9:424-2262(-)